MALYIPAGRRRRKLVVVGVVAAVLGLVLGAVLGRVTAPSLSDEVGSVRTDARAIQARLDALPLEYEQSLSGAESFADGGGPADSLVAIAADTGSLAGRAEWLTDEQRASVVATVDAAQRVAADERPAAEFDAAIAEASATVGQTFGLSSTSTTTTQGP